MYGHVAGAYQQVGIKTADPGRLVIMCYDGAIDNIKASVECYAKGELERKAETLARGMDFIGELDRSLDFDRGGEIAVKLHALYNYMLRRLTEGDLKRNTAFFIEVIDLLGELKSAWEEIFSRSPKTDLSMQAVERGAAYTSHGKHMEA